MSSDRNTSLIVDATDGGYFLISIRSPHEDEWEPPGFPEQPGEVLSSGNGAVVNSLGGSDDERVLLSCLLLNRPLTEGEVQRRESTGAKAVRFTFEAHGPILVLANDLEEQGTLADELATSIELEGCIFMIDQEDKLDPDDPTEEHHLRLWPRDSKQRVVPWWLPNA